MDSIEHDIAKSLVGVGTASSCYFRSSVQTPYRKALLQITERCNLSCAHCFVSAGDYGDTVPFQLITDVVIPKLKQSRVSRVTLTGGEPFAHPDIVAIAAAFVREGVHVGICTNATLITSEQLERLAGIGGIHFNVSLDGFRPESHGKFRGNKDSFWTTIETIRQLAQHRLLQGLLVTPNNLTELAEYSELCEFATENGAAYVLMNPLSNFGRGVRSQKKLATSRRTMEDIRAAVEPYRGRVQLVQIRFPNQQLPLASCEAGNIIYVFTHGEVTICPYLVFAARTPGSKHSPDEFMVGNIFSDPDIAERLDAFRFSERYPMGANSTCRSCSISPTCGKGCPAAVVAAGQYIGQLDSDVCPVVSHEES